LASLVLSLFFALILSSLFNRVIALNTLDPISSAFIEAIVFSLVSQGLGVFRLIADLLAKRAAVAEGFGNRVKSQNRRYDQHYYELNGLRFEVSGVAYNALIVGMPYRIYFAPHSKVLFSLEPLEMVTDSASETNN
jgi:hypothetical protein